MFEINPIRYFFRRSIALQKLKPVQNVDVEALPKRNRVGFIVNDYLPVEVLDEDFIDNISTITGHKLILELNNRNYLGEIADGKLEFKKSKNKNEIIIIPRSTIGNIEQIFNTVVIGFLNKGISVAVNFGSKKNVCRQYDDSSVEPDSSLTEHFKMYPQDTPKVYNLWGYHAENELTEEELYPADLIDSDILEKINFYSGSELPKVEIREAWHGLIWSDHVFVVFKPVN